MWVSILVRFGCSLAVPKIHIPVVHDLVWSDFVDFQAASFTSLVKIAACFNYFIYKTCFTVTWAELKIRACLL